MPKRSASADCRAIRSEHAVVVSLSVKNRHRFLQAFDLIGGTPDAPHIFNYRSRMVAGRNGQKRHRQTGIRILLNVFHLHCCSNALIINKHQQLVFFSGSLKRDGLEVCKRAV
jgi:hypothetical protein